MLFLFRNRVIFLKCDKNFIMVGYLCIKKKNDCWEFWGCVYKCYVI